MKFSKVIVGLFMAATLSSSAQAQKKVIDEQAYARWRRVDNYALSADGRHVTYKYTNIDNEVYYRGGDTFYLFDNMTKKTMMLDSVSNLNFCAGGAWLSYNQQQGGVSKHMLMRMRDKKVMNWTKDGAPNFEDSKQALVSYTINNGSDLVLFNINSGDSTVFKGVKCVKLYDNSNRMLYMKEGKYSNDIYYGRTTAKAKHTLLYRDTTKTLTDFSYHQKSRKGTFQVAQQSGSKECNLFYEFNLANETVTLLFDSNDVEVEDGLFINKNSLTRTTKGRYIPFEVYTFDTSKKREKSKEKPKKDERFELELWSWNDPVSQNIQAVRGYNEAKVPALLYAYDTKTKKTHPLIERLYTSTFYSPSTDTEFMFYSDDYPYSHNRDWEHDQYADFYLVNLATGETKQFKKRMSERVFWSPNGDYIVYFDSDARAWMSLEPKSFTFRRLSDDIPYPVHDESYDKPNSVPAYGLAAWASDGSTMLINDKYDIWAVDLTGKNKTYCYTRGYGRLNNYTLRLLNPSYSDLTIDMQQPYDLDMFNLTTMDNGIGTLIPSSGRVVKNIEGAFNIKVNRNSASGDVYLYFKQNFNNDRDLWVSDSKFKREYKVTDANPQQKEYKWGTVELVEWTNYEGKQNRGLLYLPEDYQKGKSYPAIVNFYETHSHDKSIYYAPAYSSAMLDVATYVSNGYIVFMPDVYFTIGEPGKSSYNSVVSGTKALIERGILDADRIGLQGHSWSGYLTSYLITKTNLFKCVNTGAPIVNMTSAYNGIREGSGMPRMFMYEQWQCRMGATMWDALDNYIESSPILSADKIYTPTLIFHCDKDEAVSYYEGRSLFLALRRLQRPAWLLNYKGEGHFVNKPEAKRDWTIRMQQFFDHYLKGTAMPRWMAEGININERGYDQKYDLVEIN